MAGPGQYEGYKTAERRGSNRVLALIALLSSLALVQSAQAQTFTVLHSFEASFSFDGEYPDGSLIADSSGNLYGSTYWGGDYNFGAGFGTLFTVNASTGYLQMYEFTGTSGGNFVDGANPFAGLVAGKSNMLYGTTYDGGASGYGIVFTFNLDGKEETVLYNFAGGKDGAFPTGALIVDANGNLYGTTAEGGRFGLGTIFKAGTAGKNPMPKAFYIDAVQCAEEAVAGIKEQKARVIPGAAMRAAMLPVESLPKAMVRQIATQMGKKARARG